MPIVSNSAPEQLKTEIARFATPRKWAKTQAEYKELLLNPKQQIAGRQKIIMREIARLERLVSKTQRRIEGLRWELAETEQIDEHRD